MHKPKKRSEAVATAIRLPQEMHEWLRDQPGGITDTIKRGFEMLRFAEGADDPSRQLALVLFGIAHEIEREAGAAWHKDGKAHRAFRRALVTAISKWRPDDYDNNLLNSVALDPLEERPHASQPILDADELGITIAHEVLELPDPADRERLRSARERSLQEMIRLHRSRGEEGND